MTDTCALCEKSPKECRCSFKRPKKGKWARQSEIYTTIPRKMEKILHELAEHYQFSAKSERKFIFKFTAIEIKPLPAPPETTEEKKQ